MDIVTLITEQIVKKLALFNNNFTDPLDEYAINLLQLVNLIVSLEDHHGIKFTSEEILSSHFSCVNAINDLITEKLRAKQRYYH